MIADRSRIRQELCALSNGYLFLRGLAKAYDPVMLLKASEAEHDRVGIQDITTVPWQCIGATHRGQVCVACDHQAPRAVGR